MQWFTNVDVSQTNEHSSSSFGSSNGKLDIKDDVNTEVEEELVKINENPSDYIKTQIAQLKIHKVSFCFQ